MTADTSPLGSRPAWTPHDPGLSAWCITTGVSLGVVTLAPTTTWLVSASLVASAIVVWRRMTPPLRFFCVLYLASFIVLPSFSQTTAPVNAEGASLVIGLWFLGFVTGARLGSRRLDARTTPTGRPETLWASRRHLVVLGVAGLLVRCALLVSGQLGLEAQYSSGTSESGPLALFAIIGSVCAAAAFWVGRGEPETRPGFPLVTTGLVLAHAASLAFSGFRGAGPLYLIVVWIVGAESRRRSAVPQGAKWAVVGVALVAVGIGLFAVGAAARQGYAADAGKSSESTAGIPTQEAILLRLDGRTPLEVAYSHRHDSLARDAVAVRDQVAAVIPRVIYPDKPVVNYGTRVAYAYYGIPYSYRTSSTVTFLGDIYINAGLAGVCVVAALLGLLLQRAFQRLLSADTGMSYAVSYVLVAALLRIESPLILNAVEVLRELIALILILALARAVAPLAGRRLRAAPEHRPRRVPATRPNPQLRPDGAG